MDPDSNPNPAVLINGEGAGSAVATLASQGLSTLVHAKAQAIAPVQSSRTTYRLSTVIFIALISFLFGSLLRSLLSPADFIYFTNSRDDSEIMRHDSAPGHVGWREVRRLVELKHSAFGWDFVLAVVRRPRA